MLILLLACKGDNDVVPIPGTGDILIRVWNNTGHELKEVYVNTSGGENSYEELNHNMKSSYRRFKTAYRYAFISFQINEKSYAIQPIDYVGEEPLEKGSYTYKIGLNSLGSTSASLEFIVDEKN